MTVINNDEQMFKIAKGCRILSDVYSYYPKKQATIPFGVLYRISKVPDLICVPDEVRATMTYSLDIYSTTNAQIQTIVDQITQLYMPYSIHVIGDSPIYNATRDITGRSLTLQYKLDKDGGVTH